MRAINVIIKRDLADYPPFVGKIEKNTLFDTTTPYGYGGWLIEGENYSALQAAYEDFCQKEHIICEFVRFHPLLENWRGLDELYTEIQLGETVFMDTSSEETIWNNLTSKNRNMIRKARKKMCIRDRQRQCNPAVQKTDCRGRAGDGHASGDYPVFHDYSGGGFSGASGGSLRGKRGNFRPGYGKAGKNRRAGA